MDENKQTNENLKYALCYVPVVAIILHFVEKNKTPILEKHIRYGMVLFIAYVVLTILISWLFTWLLFFAYIWLSIFLWYKTYSWEFVEIKFIDDIFDKNKTNKSEKKDDLDQF